MTSWRRLSVTMRAFWVVGAHALAAHGYPRATVDLDIWIDRNPENVKRVWRALVEFGAPLNDLNVREDDLTRPEMVGSSVFHPIAHLARRFHGGRCSDSQPCGPGECARHVECTAVELVSYRKQTRLRTEHQALDALRGRIVSGIHGGVLHPGDRLLSYRELASATGVDLRAAGRIYAHLSGEGLVEVRGKTGVYVAHQEKIGGELLAETARWAVGVLRDVWRRRVPLPEYPELVRRCIATRTVRCACIESTLDQLATLCTDLSRDFGFATAPVHADRLLGWTPGDPTAQLPLELQRAECVVTTAFQASMIRPIAKSLAKPLVVVRLDADFRERVRRQLANGGMTVICVDARFVERVRVVLATEYPDRVRGVLAHDRHALARLDCGTPALISAAARKVLQGVTLPPPIVPFGMSVLAAESAEELIELLVRLNLESLQSPQETRQDLEVARVRAH